MSRTNVPQQAQPGDVWHPEHGWIPAGEDFDPTATGNFVPNMNQAWQGPPAPEPPVELNLSDRLKARMGVQSMVVPVTKSERIVSVPLKKLLAATGVVVLSTGMSAALLDDLVISKSVDALLKFQTASSASADHGVAEGNDQAPQ